MSVYDEMLVDNVPEPEGPGADFSASAIKARSPWQLAFERLRHDRVAVASAVVIVLIAGLAVFAPVVAAIVGHGPDTQFHLTGLTPEGIPIGPSKHFLLGADELGRDILVRICYGARISLLVGVVASGLAVTGGAILGMLAGYMGRLVDTTLARLIDVVLAMPYLVFAIALWTALGGQGGILLDVSVIAFFSFGAVARIVRGQVLSIKEKEYIEAARSLGAGTLRIMFVDIGTTPPTPDWGSMLSEALNYYEVAWWYVVFPGLALLATTLAFNLLGDSVRDAFDPRYSRIFTKEK
jgi:peptide/nickel transport system permease protein